MSIRLAHIYNHQAAGGGNAQATTLLEEWAQTDEIDPIGVHAANLGSPESFISEELAYPLMYPSSIEDGLREIDPDLIFVHGFSPELNSRLKGLHEADDFESTFVLRKGMNLFEHWGLIFDHNNHKKITHQVTEFGWYDCIVCPTKHTQERVSLCYADDAPRLAYIPNGIRNNEYVPSSYMKDGKLEVITVSRGGPNEFLLSPLLAVARLGDRDDIDVELRMFGANFAGIDRAVKSLASDYDHISVNGWVDHDQLRSGLEASDVVCVPSISHQAVPLAALEGMAAGNVVLTSFPEADEEPALIKVPATHPPAWHQAITDAHEDPDDARDVVREGIERAADYDVKRIVHEGYIPVFEELVG